MNGGKTRNPWTSTKRYQKQCRRCNGLYHTSAKHGTICGKCTKSRRPKNIKYHSEPAVPAKTW